MIESGIAAAVAQRQRSERARAQLSLAVERVGAQAAALESNAEALPDEARWLVAWADAAAGIATADDD